MSVRLCCMCIYIYTHSPNRYEHPYPRSSGRARDLWPLWHSVWPSEGPARSRSPPPRAGTPERDKHRRSASLWTTAHTSDQTLDPTHLHLSLLHHQLPVSVSTHVLQRVGHVILNHLLHLSKTQQNKKVRAEVMPSQLSGSRRRTLKVSITQHWLNMTNHCSSVMLDYFCISEWNKEWTTPLLKHHQHTLFWGQVLPPENCHISQS